MSNINKLKNKNEFIILSQHYLTITLDDYYQNDKYHGCCPTYIFEEGTLELLGVGLNFTYLDEDETFTYLFLDSKIDSKVDDCAGMMVKFSKYTNSIISGIHFIDLSNLDFHIESTESFSIDTYNIISVFDKESEKHINNIVKYLIDKNYDNFDIYETRNITKASGDFTNQITDLINILSEIDSSLSNDTNSKIGNIISELTNLSIDDLLNDSINIKINNTEVVLNQVSQDDIFSNLYTSMYLKPFKIMGVLDENNDTINLTIIDLDNNKVDFIKATHPYNISSKVFKNYNNKKCSSDKSTSSSTNNISEEKIKNLLKEEFITNYKKLEDVNKSEFYENSRKILKRIELMYGETKDFIQIYENLDKYIDDVFLECVNNIL